MIPGIENKDFNVLVFFLSLRSFLESNDFDPFSLINEPPFSWVIDQTNQSINHSGSMLVAMLFEGKGIFSP